MTTNDDRSEPEMRTATVEESAPRATMGEFSHTNPYTGKAFGQDSAFARGPGVAADGGHGDDAERVDADDATDEAQTMRDVDHDHPDADAADANRVFERGTDERTDPV